MPTPSRQDIKELIESCDDMQGGEVTVRILAVCMGLLHRISALEDAKPKSRRKAAPAPPDGSGITEGNGNGKCPTTPQSKRIADIFHRRHTTAWSDKEIVAYKKLRTIPEEDLKAVEAYYKSDAQYLRRDLYTFLNNFSGEVDRAHAWKKEHRTSSRSTFVA